MSLNDSSGWFLVLAAAAAFAPGAPLPGAGGPVSIQPVETFVLEVRGSGAVAGPAFDGKHLWVAVQGEGAGLLRCSLEGKVLQTFPFPRGKVGNPGGGLAFDGHFLYNLDYDTRYETGKSRIHRFSLGGKLLESVLAWGEANTFGLAWDGTDFFQGHRPGPLDRSSIYSLDDRGGFLEKRPASFLASGLAWDGIHLWACDYQEKRVRKLGSGLEVLEEYSTEISPLGLAWVDGVIWCTELNEKKLHKLFAGFAAPSIAGIGPAPESVVRAFAAGCFAAALSLVKEENSELQERVALEMGKSLSRGLEHAGGLLGSGDAASWERYHRTLEASFRGTGLEPALEAIRMPGLIGNALKSELRAQTELGAVYLEKRKLLLSPAEKRGFEKILAAFIAKHAGTKTAGKAAVILERLRAAAGDAGRNPDRP